jgi:hypothetical protein
VDGFFDRHSVAHEFHCGSEWLAWLKGWRVGQKELHRQKQTAANLMEAISGQWRLLTDEHGSKGHSEDPSAEWFCMLLGTGSR